MDDRGVDWPPYPAALRLYAIAVERWAEIDSAYANVDLLLLPPHRFLNCVFGWCVERINPDKREDWEMMLEAPLPGQEKKATPAQAESEGQAFMALMQMNKKGAPSGT